VVLKIFKTKKGAHFTGGVCLRNERHCSSVLNCNHRTDRHWPAHMIYKAGSMPTCINSGAFVFLMYF